MLRCVQAARGLYLWHGRALVLGPGIDSTPHAHYAAQISLALDRPVRVRSASAGPDADWIETEAVVFAPNAPHQLDCGGALMAHLFVELPLRQRVVRTTLNADFRTRADFAPVRAGLERALRGELDIGCAEQLAQQWLCCALPEALTPYAYDRRIAASLAWIDAHPDVRPSGAFLSDMVHLSESRYTHLFRHQTGLSLSRYLLWARLLAGVELIARGENTTTAAHQAGFSDLAHMSRTFRGTFGVAPSALQKMTIAFKQN